MEKWVNQVKDYTQIYSLSSAVSKAKSLVYNYTEFEIKVREATSNDKWGASTTQMADIAQGTFHYSHFNDIMETIYRRLQEKAGHQWRQVYKALQLLEYLIKNGSERVVDVARDRIYEVKAMKEFHYIDDKGRDQGINIRRRAKDIQDLLSDTDRIKDERRKAKENKDKFAGHQGGFRTSPSLSDFGAGSSLSGHASSSLAGGEYASRYSDYGPSQFRDSPTASPEPRAPAAAPASAAAVKQVNLLDIDDWDTPAAALASAPAASTVTSIAAPTAPATSATSSRGPVDLSSMLRAPPGPTTSTATSTAATTTSGVSMPPIATATTAITTTPVPARPAPNYNINFDSGSLTVSGSILGGDVPVASTSISTTSATTSMGGPNSVQMPATSIPFSSGGGATPTTIPLGPTTIPLPGPPIVPPPPPPSTSTMPMTSMSMAPTSTTTTTTTMPLQSNPVSRSSVGLSLPTAAAMASVSPPQPSLPSTSLKIHQQGSTPATTGVGASVPIAASGAAWDGVVGSAWGSVSSDIGGMEVGSTNSTNNIMMMNSTSGGNTAKTTVGTGNGSAPVFGALGGLEGLDGSSPWAD